MPQNKNDDMMKNEKNLQIMRRFFDMFNEDTLTKADFVKSFENVVKMVTDLRTEIRASITKINGDILEKVKELSADVAKKFDAAAETLVTAIDAKLRTTEARVDAKLAQVDAKMLEVRDGDDADEERVIASVKEQIQRPIIDTIEDELPQLGTKMRDALELLQDDERLDISAIKGWEAMLADAKKTGKPVTFVGGARGVYVYIGGVKKGIMNTINFAAGSNMSIAYSKVNGFDTLTFNASSGGSGSTIETPAESPDATITEFTVSAEPVWVNADGTQYFDGAGYTYNSGTGKITMDVAPSSFIRVAV